MDLPGLIIQILSGMSVGMVTFLTAAGLSIIFGTLRVLNLAHGSFYMVGAYLCYWIGVTFSKIYGVFWLTLLLVPIVVVLIGAIIEILILRPAYSREHLDQFLLTFAVILIIGDLCKIFWGVSLHAVSTPWPMNQSITIMGRLFPLYNIFLILCGVFIFICLLVLIHNTQLGSIIRAVTYNRDMANALGCNVPLVYTGVFMLGSWLAALGGVLIAPISSVTPGMDLAILGDCFVIVVLGGLGSLGGVFLGSIIFGFLNSFGILVAPRLSIAFGFILMIIVLVIRPWGLMGKRE